MDKNPLPSSLQLLPSSSLLQYFTFNFFILFLTCWLFVSILLVVLDILFQRWLLRPIAGSRRTHDVEAEAQDSDDEVELRASVLAAWLFRMRFHLALEQLPPTTKYGGGEGASVYSGCPICLKEFEEGEDCQVIPECNHVFHCPCIEEWLMRNQICPVCRRSLLPGITPFKCCT